MGFGCVVVVSRQFANAGIAADNACSRGAESPIGYGLCFFEWTSDYWAMPPFLSTHGQELESLVDRFEEAWQVGEPPAIDDFLLREAEPARRSGALLALVAVDPEYRWKLDNPLDSVAGSGESAAPPKTASGLPPRPRVEEYLRRFTEFGEIEALPLELIAAEYRARHRWGDKPTQDEYAARFAWPGQTLRFALSNVDKELATIQMNPANDRHESPRPGASRVTARRIARRTDDSTRYGRWRTRSGLSRRPLADKVRERLGHRAGGARHTQGVRPLLRDGRVGKVGYVGRGVGLQVGTDQRGFVLPVADPRYCSPLRRGERAM